MRYLSQGDINYLFGDSPFFLKEKGDRGIEVSVKSVLI